VLTDRVSAENIFFTNAKRAGSYSHTNAVDDSANAGFTTGRKAWFLVNPNYKEINATQALRTRTPLSLL